MFTYKVSRYCLLALHGTPAVVNLKIISTYSDKEFSIYITYKVAFFEFLEFIFRTHAG